MKILSINKFFWRKGGSEAVFFNEKNLMESHGHKVVPFSMRGPDNEPSDYSKYFIEEINYDAGGALSKLKAAATVLYSFEARNKMRQLLKTYKPDVAHFHIFQHQITPSVFGPLKEAGVPLVLTLHDLKPICPNYRMYTNGHVCEECYGRKFYKCFSNRCNKGSTVRSLISTTEMYLHYALGYYQNVDRYIAVSRFYQQKMIEFGFPESQVSYIPNYIDTDAFPVSDRDENYVLSFGRLSEEKGIETLLQAAAIRPDIPIVIAGTGPAEKKLNRIADAHRLSNVSFVGFKAGRDIKDLVANASFTVITSKWYENCPMAVLESLAVGKPVIGANIGGIPELIEDGVDGLIYNTDSPEDLAEKIDALWKLGNERLNMGKEGRKKIEEQFHPELHYEQLMQIYSEIKVQLNSH